MRDTPAPPAEPVVAISHLSREFGGRSALVDVSLTVPAGSVFGLVGENGAGKSTLIKHCLGLWRAQTGTVRVFGLDPVADEGRTVVFSSHLGHRHGAALDASKPSP